MKKLFSLFAAMMLTIVSFAADVTVYFHNTEGWTSVYAYAWTPSNAVWPGEKMSPTNMENYYAYVLTGDQQNIIFNNGSGTQTADLKVAAGRCYDWTAKVWGDAPEGIQTEGGDPGPGPEPTDVTYYIKNNWNAGAWNWEKMTANADKTEWTYTNVFGGTGVNINTESSDVGAAWFAVASILGDEIAAGDSVTFTYNVEKKTVTAVKLSEGDPTPGPGPEPTDVTYYIKNGWNGGDWTWEEMTANADKTEWSYTNVFGGVGVNINTESSDAGAAWFPVDQIGGDAIAAGDSVTFTYNVEAKTVSAVKLSEGDPTPGPGPEPTDVTYYIKNGWNGGDWTWEEMTPNEEKTEWTYTNVFGGVGVNINTESSDAGAAWFAVAAILGDEIAAGDSVTFTYNVEAKTVSAVKLSEGDPTPGPGPEPTDVTYYIKNGWNGGDWTWEEMTPNEEKTEWTYTNVFGGVGVNINTESSDVGAAWFAVASILGDEIAAGDSVTFTYNVEAKTVTAVKLSEGDPTPGPGPEPEVYTYYLTGNETLFAAMGKEGSWNPDAFGMKDGSITFTAPAGDYAIKVTKGDWTYAKGYSDLNTEASSEGLTTDGTDNNILFTVEVENDVTVSIADDKVTVVGTFKKGEPGPEPEVYTYYLTGNETLFAAMGKEGSWNPDAFGMKDGSITFTAPAGDYAIKVTKGDWTYAKGYSDLNTEASSEGLTTDGTDNNILFTVEVENDVTVSIADDKVTVVGTFKKGEPGPEPTEGIVFTVTVPEGTPACYIAGNLNNWSFTEMTKVDDTHYTYTYKGSAVTVATVQYKYTCGADWDYVELTAEGGTLANRSYAEADVVAKWNKVPGSDPDPDAVYYIKSQWAAAPVWTWEEMTPNADKTEWTFTGDYYGSGVNINTVADDAGASWYPADSKILGDVIVEGDNVTFTYNVADQTVTAKKNTGTNILNLLNSNETAKRMINGQLFIIREGKMFNVNGILVK